MASMRARICAATVGVVGLLAGSACGSGSDAVPQLGPDGLASYACALATAANETAVDEWDGFIGEETQAEFLMISGATGLLGALTASPLEGYEDLMEHAQTLLQGVTTIDTERLQEGLDGLVAACTEHGLPDGDPDVSEEGRVAYACALVADVRAEDRAAEDWATVGAPAGSAEGVLMAETSGFSGLLGGMNGHQVPGHEELSLAARDVVQGLTRLDTTLVDQAIVDADTYCQGL